MRYNEKITYISSSGQIVLALNTKVSPYWWTGAEGLDGLTNDIYTYHGAGQDGESVIGTNIQARHIVLEGEILINREQARRTLLRIISPKQEGKLVYTDGTITRYISCKVEQAPTISRAAIPQFQTTLRCPYPFWRDGDGSAQHLAEIAHWMPALVFDTNDGFEIIEDGIEFGTRSSSLVVNIPYTGEVPASILLEFHALADVSNPSIINVYTQESISLTFDMLAGDIIHVATGYGLKGAKLIRNGLTTNIYSAINKPVTWLQLTAGDNLLRYGASNTDDLEVTVYYDVAYLGV